MRPDDDHDDDAKADDYDEQSLLFVDRDDVWDGNECRVQCQVVRLLDMQEPYRHERIQPIPTTTFAIKRLYFLLPP